MKQKRDSFINIGFSSIIMVFIMLCLVTFATLSVLTAHSDYQLSQKSASKTHAYYKADATARDILAAIDTELFQLYQNTASVTDYYEQISVENLLKELPQSTQAFTIEQTDSSPILAYQIPITEVQTLHVALRVQYPQTGSECFTTILRWQTITHNEPDESDEFLNLYTGEN